MKITLVFQKYWCYDFYKLLYLSYFMKIIEFIRELNDPSSDAHIDLSLKIRQLEKEDEILSDCSVILSHFYLIFITFVWRKTKSIMD